METETIDITPTWSQILPTLLGLIKYGNPKGARAALEELQRMAKLADAYAAKVKRHREHTKNWRTKKLSQSETK